MLNEVFAESDLTLDGNILFSNAFSVFRCYVTLAEDCENNLKLYVDTQQGGTVMTGHELADR